MMNAGTSETPQTDKYSTWSSFLPKHTHVTPHTTTTHTPSSRSSARREAELIRARGRISQLELELSQTQHATKRARVETSLEDRVTRTATISQELQRLHTLDEERQRLVEQLAEAQQKLEEKERGEGEDQRKLQSLVDESERTIRRQRETIEELQSKVSNLGNENSHLSRQLDVAHSEREVVKAGLQEQLHIQTAAATKLRQRVMELEGMEGKWEAEQERVKELQHKLKQKSHDIQFAEMVQSKLLHSEDIERQLRQLQEENTALRNHTDNVGLMRYQLQTLREQLGRNEDMEKRVVSLEEENKSLRKQLEESEGGRGGLGGSSSGLQCKLTELQHREVVLLSQLGDLQSRLKLVQRAADKAESLATETQNQLSREQEECRLRGEKVQRLEKRLLFVSKERDGCVNVLNSYRLDSGIDALLKENLCEVERQLGRANDRITELETEVDRLTSQLSSTKSH